MSARDDYVAGARRTGQRNALVGWDLVWYVPLCLFLLLNIWPSRLQVVWSDLQMLWHRMTWWELLLVPLPLGVEFLYLATWPAYILIVPLFFGRNPGNRFFPYRRRCVVASILVALATDYLIQVGVVLAWPLWVDSAGAERISLFGANFIWPSILLLLMGAKPERAVAFWNPWVFLFALVLGTLGVAALVYFWSRGNADPDSGQ